MSEIWNLSTICRCCHSDGYFKSLLEPHNTPEGIQTYESLLRNTFGLTISQPGIEASYNICDSCMSRIKDAASLRKQVLECEEKFQEYCKNNDLPPSPTISIPIKQEIKCEKSEFKCEIEIEAIPLEVNKNEPNPKRKPQIETKTVDVQINKENKIFKRNNSTQTKKEAKIKDLKIKKGKAKSKLTGEILASIEEVTVSGNKKFSCKTCGAVYDKKIRILGHINKFHTQAYNCHCCNKNFSYKSGLQLHMETHSDIKKHACHICSKTYKLRKSLDLHLKKHKGSIKKVLCDLCGHSFNEQTNLNIHMQTVHLKIRPFHCDMCGRSYTAKKHLKDHILRHMQMFSIKSKTSFTCHVCGKPFKSASSFECHKMLHDNKYLCRFCRKVSTDRETYLSHLRTHFKSVTCNICHKDFTTKFALKKHIDAHYGIKRFSCEICGFTFVDKTKVNRHMLTQHNPNRIRVEKIKCGICKRHVNDLSKHMEGHKVKKFSCDLCDKSYVGNDALNRHKNVVHFGVIFTCDICNKNYMSKKSLTSHTLKAH